MRIIELGNVLTRSGSLLEIFRDDWPGIEITPRQVNWIGLKPQGVTDWHRHLKQADHLVGVGGVIKLALWDDRPNSTTKGQSEIIRMGSLRPVLTIVPPGVWHGLRNESGEFTSYLNVIAELFEYDEPDNWRLQPGAAGIPDIL